MLPCPQCGAEATVSSRLEDLYGPYSPYSGVDEGDFGQKQRSEHGCIHLLECSNCGHPSYVVVQLAL